MDMHGSIQLIIIINYYKNIIRVEYKKEINGGMSRVSVPYLHALSCLVFTGSNQAGYEDGATPLFSDIRQMCFGGEELFICDGPNIRKMNITTSMQMLNSNEEVDDCSSKISGGNYFCINV